MNTSFYVTSPNSNEIYTVSEPNTLLNFCAFDFTSFMDNCTELSRRFMKTGEYQLDEVVALRNSIISCHKYYENNIKSVFDKIVIDCWIDNICRQNEMSRTTLWNTFIGCSSDFERAVFMRLSDYRSKRAINQWENLLRQQEYARKKIDYIFGTKLGSASSAANRSNCFDLMFAVAANEQGYRLSEIGSTRVFKAGQLPNAPFTLKNAAKEINRNVLSSLKYSDEIPVSEKGELSDRDAMDVFALIENYIPSASDSLSNTIAKSLSSVPKNIYVPSNFKAMIDLEIDMIVESGSVLQRCGRCKEFFLRNADYDFDYCDRIGTSGRSCLEIMGKTAEKQQATAISNEELQLLKTKADAIYKEMTTRMGEDITQRDLSEWVISLSGLKNHVINGEATMEDFDAFVEYSRTISFIKKPVEQPQPKQTNGEPVIKPYQFQRVDRKKIERQGLLSKPLDDDIDVPTVSPRAAAAALNNASTAVKTPPPPAVIPTPMKIIRGVPVQSPAYYEPNFDAGSVQQAQAPVVSIPNGDDAAPKRPADDDVKIYSGRKPQLEPDVKVHEPKKKAPEPLSFISIPKEAANEEIKTYQSHAVNAYKAASTLPSLEDELPYTEPVSDIAEEKPSVDFSEVLKGIERSDGFEEENVPLDADGVPLSHKTKHVMDAIMKQSKASPSLRRPPR